MLLEKLQAESCGGVLLSRSGGAFGGFARRLYLCQILVLVGLFCGVQFSAVWAAEWSLLPSIGVMGVYNSNLLLTAQLHEAAYGHWVSPAVEFAGNTERLGVSGRFATDFVSYYGGEERRFTNIFLPLTVRYKTEKDLLGFTGGFVRDNTLMSELLTTGVVLQFTQRNQLNANPTWTRNVTEKLSLQSSFQFSHTTYENGLHLGLVDHQLFGGSGGLLYQLTEQDQIQLSGSYVNFYTTNALSPFRSSYPGVNLSMVHAFTETLTGAAYGGVLFVNSSAQTAGADIRSQSVVSVFAGSLVKKFESTSVEASMARSVVPSGFGLLFQTDQVSLKISHDLSETLTASFVGSGFLTSAISQSPQTGTIPENRFFTVTPAIAWKFLEWWRLELSYTYGRREIASLSEQSAMSHATMFMVTYYPPKLAISN